MASDPVQRQETSHLDDPVSPVSAAHSAHGAGGDNAGNANGGEAGDNTSSIDHVQDAKEKEAGPTKKQKMKAHFRRFWWAYLIGLVILLAILLPILFKVIIPAIVQSIVNQQKLPVTGGAIVALSSNSLQMSLDTSLNTPLAAKIDATDLQLFNKDTEPFSPFLTITLPELSVNHKTPASIVNQTLQIEDMDELIKWFHGVFDEPQVKVAVKGDPTVRLSSLSYHPNIDTQVDVKALNYLEGFGIKDMEFILPPRENGMNVKGTLDLPNSGDLSLYLGNLTFNLMSGNLNLGYANVYEANVKPGMNNPPFDGELFFNKLIPNLGAILDQQKESLSRGALTFNATGNASVINGEHIKYVESVLNTKHIPFDLPVVSLLSDLLNGLMGDSASLSDLTGDLFGNSTLLDNIMDHWNETSSGGNNNGGGGEGSGNDNADKKKVKRVVPNSSLVWNMLRLSNRVKKHEL